MNKTSIEWCRMYATDGMFEEGFSVNPIRFRPNNIEFNEQPLLRVLKRRKPARIAWGNHADMFGEWVTDAMLDRCFAVMALTPHLTHILLTKRPERMREYVSGESADRIAVAAKALHTRVVPFKLPSERIFDARRVAFNEAWKINAWPLQNVWLGVSVEDQATADARIPLLLQTPAAVRFVSCEPLLGPVDLRATEYLKAIAKPGWQGEKHYPFESLPDESRTYFIDLLDWVIVGGESGPRARPMHPDWARQVRDQCVAAGVPLFFKQWGEWLPQTGGDDQIRSLPPSTPVTLLEADGHRGQSMGEMHGHPRFGRMLRVGKKAAGDLLDGKQWHQFPHETQNDEPRSIEGGARERE